VEPVGESAVFPNGRGVSGAVTQRIPTCAPSAAGGFHACRYRHQDRFPRRPETRRVRCGHHPTARRAQGVPLTDVSVGTSRRRPGVRTSCIGRTGDVRSKTAAGDGPSGTDGGVGHGDLASSPRLVHDCLVHSVREFHSEGTDRRLNEDHADQLLFRIDPEVGAERACPAVVARRAEPAILAVVATYAHAQAEFFLAAEHNSGQQRLGQQLSPAHIVFFEPVIVWRRMRVHPDRKKKTTSTAKNICRIATGAELATTSSNEDGLPSETTS